jgi:hypothetical protein
MLDSSPGGRFPRPLQSFVCVECGYGARARKAPDRCPMCGAHEWEAEAWRPFSALHVDLLSRRRRRTVAPTRRLVGPKTPETVRELNERIAVLSRALSQPRDVLVEFVCECGRPDCDEMIQLTLDEYGALRSGEGYLAVVLGHEPADAEVVAYTERYAFASSPR